MSQKRVDHGDTQYFGNGKDQLEFKDHYDAQMKEKNLDVSKLEL